jgi:hypothetical protein
MFPSIVIGLVGMHTASISDVGVGRMSEYLPSALVLQSARGSEVKSAVLIKQLLALVTPDSNTPITPPSVDSKLRLATSKAHFSAVGV